MGVAFFVVARDFATGGFFDNFRGDFWCEAEGEFEVAKSGAGVATREFGEVIDGFWLYALGVFLGFDGAF